MIEEVVIDVDQISPPSRDSGRRRYVHDSVTHRVEDLSGEWFREEVGEVLCGVDVRDAKLHLLDFLADEVMSAIDVFSANMVFGVVAEIDCSFVVEADRCRISGSVAEFVEEVA